MMKKTIMICGLLLCVTLTSCSVSEQSTATPTPITPTTTAEPETPATPPGAVLSWQDAYAEFLRKNIPVSGVDFDELADGSDEQARFGAFSAGGYPVTPFFYLYDIDKDEIPELIYIDAATGYDGDVYVYENNSISKMGSIKFYPFGGFGIPLDKTEGLYSDVGYKGNYGEIYLYTMNNGALTEQMALEYNNQSEQSPSQPGEHYSFDDFALIDYYEVTETNITEVIYGGA